MKYIPERWKPSKISMYGVTEAQLHAAIERIQLHNFPFVGTALALLFLGYAFTQVSILHEEGFVVMTIIAIVSSIFIYGLVKSVQDGRVSPSHANHLYAIVTSVVLFSMMFRMVVTHDIKQAANISFFAVALGMTLFTFRWHATMTIIALISWLAGMYYVQAGDEYAFYLVLMAASVITGTAAQVMLTRIYSKSEILRIENGRLFKETRQFNHELEEKVRERTQELQEAYTLLEKLDKTKSDFITIASHELRTPLTIVNANNRMLMADDDIQKNSYLQKRINGIDDAVTRMETVVGSMLDMAKIDNQSFGLYFVSMNVTMLVRIVGQQLSKAAAERNIKITIEPMQLPNIMGDMEALHKVFHHIIINAIKYTPDNGHILIKGRKVDTAVEISIADTGIGIAPDLHTVIFDKFYQTGEVMLHSSGQTTFKGGGSGLGLAIAKGIVEGHNGRLWVESDGYDEKVYPGSVFYVLLPCEGVK